MSLRKIQLIWVFALLVNLSVGQSGKKSYPEADALYLSLTKTYILHKDGSIVNTVEKRQKLLTHRAFQSLYGETRITYNPQFQQIAIKKSFTENSHLEKIETPQNGYNDILPGFNNNLKAYSHLREMVITHTGLEVGSIINCTYELNTESGRLPWLMGDEMLQTDCPIEKLTMVVKVPAGQPLFFKLLNSAVVPKIERGKEFDSYTWQMNDLPQRNREILSSACLDQPRLLFSTLSDRNMAIKWLTDQDAFKSPAGDEIKNYIDKKVGAATPLQKALKIQEIVVKELNTTNIPAALLSFRVRTPDQVWKSNAGTSFEKCCLLAAMLRAAGFDAEVCLSIPECFRDEKMPFLLVAEPIVKITTAQEENLLLSADKLNANNFELCNDHQVILELGDKNKEAERSNAGGKIEVKGNITIEKDGKIKGEISGTFSNRCNPYNDIARSSEKVSGLLPDLTGKASLFTPLQSKLHFAIEKSDALTTRGNFKFLSIWECVNGFASLHLNPLPVRRITSLDLTSSIFESYNYAYNLPNGCRLVNPINIALKGPFGKLTIQIVQHENVVEVTRELEISKSIIAPEEYPGFKEWMDSWNTPKNRQLILSTE